MVFVFSCSFLAKSISYLGVVQIQVSTFLLETVRDWLTDEMHESCTLLGEKFGMIAVDQSSGHRAAQMFRRACKMRIV